MNEIQVPPIPYPDIVKKFINDTNNPMIGLDCALDTISSLERGDRPCHNCRLCLRIGEDIKIDEYDDEEDIGPYIACLSSEDDSQEFDKGLE